MGFLDGLLGRASEVDAEKVTDEFDQLLPDGEKIEKAYQVIRDMFLFTNKRLIVVDRQGVTGKKMEYRSIPYDSIRQFSVETAGMWDRDAELKLWVAGVNEPIEKTFNKKLNVYDLQKVLADYVL